VTVGRVGTPPGGAVFADHGPDRLRRSLIHCGEKSVSAPLTGGCLCSGIRFRATRAPQRTLACHCTFCQRLTGTAFYVESIFEIDAVAFEGGETRTYAHVSDTSGKNVYVHFCARCGTTLGLTFERWPNMRAVSRSCFDTPGAIPIDAHIWTRSAQSGVALPAGIDCFARSRYMPDGETEVATRYDRPIMADEAVAGTAPPSTRS
jgi:hypothetical protein